VSTHLNQCSKPYSSTVKCGAAQIAVLRNRNRNFLPKRNRNRNKMESQKLKQYKLCQCCGSGSGIRNPGSGIRDPGLGTFLTPGSGIRDGRKSASGSGIRDEQPGSYFLELRNHFCAFLWVKILKFFDEDPGSGMETVRIRDPGWKKVGSGIRDKHPGSATMNCVLNFFY
jgi:hypothetical protein